MQLEVRAFGKLTLHYVTQEIAQFPTRQTEELLGFLLLHRNRCHTREKLISILWPDVPLEKGRHRFSIVLSRLRKLFQQLSIPFDHFFETTRQDVALMSKRPFLFDCTQFHLHLKQAKQANDPAQQEEALRQALSLYRGELLEGIYANWCLMEREALERKRLYALGQLMDCAQKRTAYEEAVAIGEAILHEDPLREEVHRALIECYAAQGRPDKVNQQYNLLSELLRSELQTHPHPDTVKIYTASLTSLALQKQSNRVTTAKMQRLETAVHAFQQSSQTLLQLLREF